MTKAISLTDPVTIQLFRTTNLPARTTDEGTHTTCAVNQQVVLDTQHTSALTW